MRKRRSRLSSYDWVIYVMMAKPENGVSEFKIGMSGNVHKRVMDIQQLYKRPLVECLYFRTVTREHAFTMEQTMHQLLAEYRIQGEWFRFDLKNATHKKDFNRALANARTQIYGCNWNWVKVDIRNYQKYVRNEAIKAEESRMRLSMYPAYGGGVSTNG